MNILIRLTWFVLVGWWLGSLWFIGSVLLMMTIIMFPFGAYTASKTWTVMTLKSKPNQIVNDVQQEVNVTVEDDE